MNFIKLKYFLVILLIQVGAVYSQEQKYIFQNLNSDNGLSQNTVFGLLKDKYGFMWFGTQDGLNKYDGYKFTVYKHIERDHASLPANTISKICEDAEGNIWVGTRVSGLSKYNRQYSTFQNFKEEKNNPASISSDRITALYLDRTNSLWVGSANGLNVYNAKSGKFKRYFLHPEDKKALTGNYIKSIYQDNKGQFWVGTATGLFLFNPKTGKSTLYVNKPTDPNSISDNDIRAIVGDDSGQLWLGTSEGLNLFDYKNEKFTRYKVKTDYNISGGLNPVTTMCNGTNHKLWVGTSTHLQLFDKHQRKFLPITEADTKGKPLEGAGILSLLEDKQGILWVGSSSLGVNKYDRNFSFFPSYKTGQKHAESLGNLIRGLSEDLSGNLYLGTDAGLQYFNRKQNKITYYEHQLSNENSLVSSYVSTVLASKQHPDEVWVGTYQSGLDCLNPKTGVFKHFNKGKTAKHLSENAISALMEDSKGNIWVGTEEGGVNIFNRTTQTFVKLLHQPNNVNSLVDNIAEAFMEDKEGNIWIGSYDSGITIYNPSTKKFTRLNSENSELSSNVVSCFYQDKKGTIWVGTMEGGFNRYNPKTKNFTAYTEQNGLINNVVYFITEDSKGFLWCSTNQGVVRFNPAKQTFKNFSTYNGLQSQEFNFGAGLKNEKNEIILGGINGINIFNPDNLLENKNSPPVQITKFELFNKPVVPNTPNSPLTQNILLTKEITLNHEQTVITLEFAALDYTRPEKNEYAYMLENFDKDWNYVGTQHKATYTNLDPGKYYFKVKASNNDGVWNEKGALLIISIKPPFWLTWWFKLLAISIVAGIIYSFYQYRINLIKAQKRKLEQEVLQRTAELRAKSQELLTQSNDLLSLNEELIAQQSLEKQAREDAEIARSEAENANLAKSTFLATMSHEIRTPMNGVLGMTSILSNTELNHEQRQYTDIIKVSGENLLHVINDILDFSKIESGNMELDLFDVNLRNLVEEVMDLFVGKTVSSGIELMYEIDADIPEFIFCDGNRLRQILINLIGNASKFTHDGEIHLKIDLINREGGELNICFEVRDTGIGIKKDKLDRLFKSFSQVDSSTTRMYGGTGLGLVICKQLVDLMGGNIIVESEVNKGSVFIFDIICTISTDESKNKPHIHPENSADKRVLLVDDNETNLRILTGQLEAWHMVVTIAVDSEQTLDILKNKPVIDLVIIDLHLPEISGRKLSAIIKANYPDIPVILMSLISDEADEEDLQLFSSVLFKPAKKKQLWNAINTEFSDIQPITSDANQFGILSQDFASLHPLSILIADDDLINHQFLAIVFLKLGYEPTFVSNGVEVLNQIENQNFQLIFMGLQMPEMDGIETTKIIRTQSIDQPVVVAMTANAFGMERDACFNAGVDDFITKPIDLSVLVAALEKASQVFNPNL